MAQELNRRVEHTYMRVIHTPNNGEITNKMLVASIRTISCPCNKIHTVWI